MNSLNFGIINGISSVHGGDNIMINSQCCAALNDNILEANRVIALGLCLSLFNK